MAKERKLKNCVYCGAEIANSVIKCPQCGGKNKKPIYKRTWFIVIMFMLVLSIIGQNGDDSSTIDANESNIKSTTVGEDADKETNVSEVEIEYVFYEVDELMNDLDTNALKANDKYKGKYVEIKGRLATIDSSGRYITLLPISNDWAFVGVTCYIKSDEQKAQVMELSSDEIVTVRGKIKDVGEILGYNLDMVEILMQ